jgi:hypothetical protein
MSAVIKTEETDFLDEDPPVHRQNYVCMSFLSPDSVIEDRNIFALKDYLSTVSESLVTLVDHLRKKFPDAGSDIDAIQQSHAPVFRPQDIAIEFDNYKSINRERLEEAFEARNAFRTSVRGVKVRGSYATREEAEKQCKALKKIDTVFDMYVAEVGKWCPWNPHPEEVSDVNYDTDALNTLMKGYKESMEARDQAYADDTNDRISKAQPIKDEGASTSKPIEDEGASTSKA